MEGVVTGCFRNAVGECAWQNVIETSVRLHIQCYINYIWIFWAKTIPYKWKRNV